MEKYLIVDEKNDSIEYRMGKDKDEIILKYSNGSEWHNHIKNTVCGKLKDDGNGIKIKIGDLKIKLDYADSEKLIILINELNNFNRNLKKIKND